MAGSPLVIHIVGLKNTGKSGLMELLIQELNKIENGVNLNGVLDALRNTQLKELGAAIQSKDPARFEVAYRDTMKMCNACHTSAAHEFIRIGIPERKPVANRIYEPATD